jgi:hypothetical protein
MADRDAVVLHDPCGPILIGGGRQRRGHRSRGSRPWLHLGNVVLGRTRHRVDPDLRSRRTRAHGQRSISQITRTTSCTAAAIPTPIPAAETCPSRTAPMTLDALSSDSSTSPPAVASHRPRRRPLPVALVAAMASEAATTAAGQAVADRLNKSISMSPAFPINHSLKRLGKRPPSLDVQWLAGDSSDSCSSGSPGR